MRIEKYIEILKNINLFKGLENSDLLSVFSDMDYTITPYKKNDIIFSEDDKCTSLSIILEGEVEIQKIDASGKVLTVAKFGRGNTFGENLIFGDKNTFPMTVVSKENTIVLHVQKPSVVRLCQNNTSFLYEFLRVISNKAVVLSSKLKEVTLKTIRQKICEFLYHQYEMNHSLTIKLTMSKKDWADKIGVQRPSLSRELIKMKEEEIIDFDKDVITILDLDTIEENL